MSHEAQAVRSGERLKQGTASPEAALARHVATLDCSNVTAATRDRIAVLLLDYVACVLAGLQSLECARLAQRAVARGGTPESSIAGVGTHVPAPAAAFVNAALAHWYEWDDVYDAGGLHASAVILPVLIASAEAAGKREGAAAGGAFVSAAIAAYDVAGRISAALTPWSASGWMPTGVASTVGAAAASARLFGLDERGVLSAMGLAGAGVGLSRQPIVDKVDGKNVLCAQAATRAVEAAYLALDGISGAPNFLAGPLGQNALVTGGRADITGGLADLGARFCADEVSFKPYPSCRATHPVVDLALDLQAEQRTDPAAIARVEAIVPQPMADMCGASFSAGENPRVAAQFSIPYTVARALAQRTLGLSDFDARAVAADEAVLELAGRVETRGVPVPPGNPYLGEPVTLRIHRNDGTVVERTTPLVKGSPARPMTDSERSTKLSDAARGRLAASQIRALLDAVMQVSQLGVAPVMDILRQACRPTSP